ncbi:MAG: 4Fe-4S binding protein [Desulfamplus sp.]|nr:4Fe-4S binding protein [Desulfamplus sp.]
MKIVNVRRISQIFFLLLFLWFCIAATLGINWWQLRGWTVNWFLELDPLVGFATLLTTGRIYKGLLWGILTIILTLIFGRFFCGWVCPFGTLHQFIGFIGKLGNFKTNKRDNKFFKPKSELARLNQYRPAQSIKYGVLFFFIASNVVSSPLLPIYLLQTTPLLLTGLLDPIPFIYRFVNLTLLPFADSAILHLSTNPRYYDGAWIIGICGVVALILNLWIPRFYCRYICPLGALFGLLSSISFFQIGKKSSPCIKCIKCQFHCEGACDPMGKIRLSECVLCMNCLDQCAFLTYQAAPSAAGQISESTLLSEVLPFKPVREGKVDNKSSQTDGQYALPEISRREFAASVVLGVTVVPMIHLNAAVGSNWNTNLIRPPGSLPESEFLARCIKCGQCIRVCPTNVIQPADIVTGGFEGLWTPALNFRIGSSGCQLHCIACGNLCPTGAILPLNLDQRFGINDYKEKGPVRIGTAFVDQGRCLPWSMTRPCIVCQENCPVSPKAIMISETFAVLKSGTIKSIENSTMLNLDISNLAEGAYSTGDYCAKDMNTLTRRLIVANTQNSVTLSSSKESNSNKTSINENNVESDKGNGFKTGSKVVIEVRLQRPVIDPSRCIGCGVCEHECPVKGKRAIRVTAENESRNRNHALI